MVLKKITYSARGGVAQLGEHLPCKQGVKSSNLSISMQIMKRVPESNLQEQPMHTCVHKDANAQIRNSGLKRTLKTAYKTNIR